MCALTVVRKETMNFKENGKRHKGRLEGTKREKCFNYNLKNKIKRIMLKVVIHNSESGCVSLWIGLWNTIKPQIFLLLTWKNWV